MSHQKFSVDEQLNNMWQQQIANVKNVSSMSIPLTVLRLVLILNFLL